MPMLSLSQSSMQCYGAWCTMHKLQIGRSGMHRVGEQAQEVSFPFPCNIRSPSPEHKQRFCLINSVARCRHAISAKGSVFGLAICGASNLLQSRGANGHHYAYSICAPLTNYCRKYGKDDDPATENTTSTSTATRKIASRDALDSVQTLNSVSSRGSHESESRRDEHVPHSICTYIHWLHNLYWD
jgi:hypothetical protein